MNGLLTNIVEVLRVALPLLVSTAMFSLVLFTDRTLLYTYDKSSMSASMTGEMSSGRWFACQWGSLP